MTQFMDWNFYVYIFGSVHVYVCTNLYAEKCVCTEACRLSGKAEGMLSVPAWAPQ